jgi:hypothetical protein
MDRGDDCTVVWVYIVQLNYTFKNDHIDFCGLSMLSELKRNYKPWIVAHACYPSTQEAEVGRPQVQGQPEQCSEDPVSKNKKTTKQQQKNVS